MKKILGLIACLFLLGCRTNKVLNQRVDGLQLNQDVMEFRIYLPSEKVMSLYPISAVNLACKKGDDQFRTSVDSIDDVRIQGIEFWDYTGIDPNDHYIKILINNKSSTKWHDCRYSLYTGERGSYKVFEYIDF